MALSASLPLLHEGDNWHVVPHPVADEPDLLNRARAGDSRAFSQLMGRHRATILNICGRICVSQAVAEEACQETLLAAWRGLPNFRAESSIEVWLYRIATNAAVRASTRERRTQSVASEVLLHAAHPGHQPFDELLAAEDLLRRALDMLRPQDRALLAAADTDLSGSQLAEIFDLPEGACRVRLHRARKAYTLAVQHLVHQIAVDDAVE